jgi:hypothetical protein
VENLQVSIIDGAGHVPMEEVPEETVRIAYRFLTDGKELPDDTTTEKAESSGDSNQAPKLDDIDEGGEASAAASGGNDSWGDSAPAAASTPAAVSEPANDNSYDEPAPAPAPAPAPKKRSGMADW